MSRKNRRMLRRGKRGVNGAGEKVEKRGRA